MGDRLHQISNLAGTLSMANTGHPDSGGSQFFINVGGKCECEDLHRFSAGENSVRSNRTVYIAFMLFLLFACKLLLLSDNTFLDWFEPSTDAAHPVFGRIMENYNLVLQISQVSTRNDNPLTPIKMISVRVK